MPLKHPRVSMKPDELSSPLVRLKRGHEAGVLGNSCSLNGAAFCNSTSSVLPSARPTYLRASTWCLEDTTKRRRYGPGFDAVASLFWELHLLAQIGQGRAR
jgi:hypothetical protein